MNAPSTPSGPPAAAGTGRIRTLIVDDEPAARRGLRLLLERDAGIAIVGEAANGLEAVEFIRRERPELVFLDVQMPGADGFETLRRLAPAETPTVVFVTAFDEYALRAFEVQAVDYLLKPYDDARFAAALHRAKAEVQRRQGETVNTRLAQLLEYLQTAEREGTRRAEAAGDRILLKSSGEILLFKPEEIDWVEAEGDYMKFHVGGKAHLMRETMARLEARLDPARFIRIHRSTIVNLDRVRKLSPSFAGEYVAVLQDGTKLRLSRSYHERLAELLAQAR